MRAPIWVAAAAVVHVPLHYVPKTWAEVERLRQWRADQGDQRFVPRHVDAEPYLPMTDIFDGEYLASLAVGTPPQHFTVMLDTGSANLWIPSSDCTTGRNRYAAGESSTSGKPGPAMRIPYAAGDVIGHVRADTVRLGNVSLEHCPFAEIQSVKPQGVWDRVHVDGVLGLGPGGKLTVGAVTPPVQELQKAAGTAVFGLYLGPSPVLSVGGQPDKRYYAGAVTWAPLAPTQKAMPYWLVAAKDVQLGGSSLGLCMKHVGCSVIFDAGTSVLLGPPMKVHKLLQKIGPVAEDCSNLRSLPSLSFTIADKVFPLTAADYVLRRQDVDGKDRCTVAIEPVRVALPIWVLGTPFLRRYVSVYDAQKRRVGLAAAVAQSTGMDEPDYVV